MYSIVLFAKYSVRVVFLYPFLKISTHTHTPIYIHALNTESTCDAFFVLLYVSSLRY